LAPWDRFDRGAKMTRATASHAALVTFLLAAACNALEPQVGPLQDGGLNAQGDAAMCQPPDPAYARSNEGGASDAGDPACLPDSGLIDDNACDMCEAQNCCATRVACLGDNACNCADQGLDSCIRAATGMTGQGYGVAPDCVTQFSATNAAAAARMSCDRVACKVACAF
jgi:hypothetical protein